MPAASATRDVVDVYRNIIDGTLAASRADFEEHGIDDSVRETLQSLWESKLAATQVADFSGDYRLSHFADVAAKAAQAKAAAAAANTTPALDDAADSPDAVPSSSGEDSPEPEPVKPKADDDLLGSDLDDSDDEDDGEGADAADSATRDVVIALYEKVTHTKNKWKVVLKDGVIHAEGKEYNFSRCAGDFVW